MCLGLPSLLLCLTLSMRGSLLRMRSRALRLRDLLGASLRTGRGGRRCRGCGCLRLQLGLALAALPLEVLGALLRGRLAHLALRLRLTLALLAATLDVAPVLHATEAPLLLRVDHRALLARLVPCRRSLLQRSLLRIQLSGLLPLRPLLTSCLLLSVWLAVGCLMRRDARAARMSAPLSANLLLLALFGLTPILDATEAPLPWLRMIRQAIRSGVIM